MASMIQPHELCLLGMDHKVAVKVIRLLAKEGFGKVYTLAYHDCADCFIEMVPEGERLPSVCSECEAEFPEWKLNIALVKP